MDENANMHWIVDVDVVHELAMNGDSWRIQARNIDRAQVLAKAGNSQTRQLFDGDRDQGQSRCLRNFQQIFKLSVIEY